MKYINAFFEFHVFRSPAFLANYFIAESFDDGDNRYCYLPLPHGARGQSNANGIQKETIDVAELNRTGDCSSAFT